MINDLADAHNSEQLAIVVMLIVLLRCTDKVQNLRIAEISAKAAGSDSGAC